MLNISCGSKYTLVHEFFWGGGGRGGEGGANVREREGCAHTESSALPRMAVIPDSHRSFIEGHCWPSDATMQPAVSEMRQGHRRSGAAMARAEHQEGPTSLPA